MSTTTTIAPRIFKCDGCGTEELTEHRARQLNNPGGPLCLDCESRYLSSDAGAAEAAYELLLDTAKRALAGYLAPEDARAALAEAIQCMDSVPAKTRDELIHAEHRNADMRRAREGS